uniref:Reverse transcriptase n=1 Tax=Caenorhabditis tropicalis TaxID=1561998 RepID=A0A1I7T584_9PELO
MGSEQLAAIKLLADSTAQAQQQMMQMFMKFMQDQQSTPKTANKVDIVNMLNGRIPTFSHNPEDGMTFDNWYGRYAIIIDKEGGDMEEEEKARFIVSKLGNKESELFRNHILPDVPEKVALKETIEMLSKLFDETKSLSLRRYEFLTIKTDGPPNKEYTALVKSMFNRTKWDQVTNDSIQCLVYICGLNIEYRLRAMRELENKPGMKVAELADTLEAALKIRSEGALIGSSPLAVQAVNKSQQKSSPNHSKGKKTFSSSTKPGSTSPSAACYLCGGMHWRKDCTLPKTTVCNKCKKTGHLAKVCKNKKETQTNNVVYIGHSSTGNGDKIHVTVNINDIPIKMIVDTGAEATLISYNDYEKLNRPKLVTPSINLRAANHSSIPIKGQLNCNFSINDRKGFGHCYVTDTPSLLGMDWMGKDPLICDQIRQSFINAVSQDLTAPRRTLEAKLHASFPDVFKDGLGLCNKAKAAIHLKPESKPIFRKARPVAYAALPKVTTELDRLVARGIITPTEYSDFATPIVVVDKKDGSIRMCADFSTGLNDAIETHHYPLPTAEAIFSTLNGGKFFTQIDLAEAYLQIEVEEESKKMLTINTHLGLFYYNRMPFGVKTAPAIFQQVVDTMIAGLQGVAAYMDDLIICGSTIEEHNQRLHELFNRIEDYGFRVKAAKCAFLQP